MEKREREKVMKQRFWGLRQAAIECREWINWYMPYLHHHHHLEDEYW